MFHIQSNRNLNIIPSHKIRELDASICACLMSSLRENSPGIDDTLCISNMYILVPVPVSPYTRNIWCYVQLQVKIFNHCMQVHDVLIL